jgi:hypothetical protein
MKRLVSGIVLAGVLAVGGAGCMHNGHVHRSSGVEVLAVGLLAGAAIASAASTPEPEPHTIYVNNVYYVNGPPPERVAQPRPLKERDTPDELPSFDPHAARGALNAIDVSGCQAAGAKQGFGHAKVTMNPDGRVSKVVVDEPAGLPPEAARCIGDRIGTATVAPFKGSLVTVGTTYHVR